jgi:hypothetical protein
MTSLLSVSIGIDKALRTGSLLTAKDAMLYLKSVFPAYADIGDWAIASLEVFL